MKTLALAFLLSGLSAVQTPSIAPAVPLRRSFMEGAVDRYKIDDTVQQTVTSAMGEMPMTISSSRTYAVKTSSVDVASGTAKIEATTTVDKMDATGPAASMLGEKPKPVVQTGKMDVRGRVSFDATPSADVAASLLSGTQATISAGTFVEFPEKPVKVGDAWDILVPKNPFVFDQDQHLTATLIGEKTVDGVAVWTVAVKGTIKTLVDSAKLPAVKGTEMPMQIRINGQVDLSGEGTVEKSTGRTLTMETKGATKMKIELGDSGLTLDTVGTLTSKVKLQG